MSVQNALKLIHNLRKAYPENVKHLTSMEELADLSKTYDLVCSAEELRTAFYTDWKMRWANFRDYPAEK